MHKTSKVLSFASWHQARSATIKGVTMYLWSELALLSALQEDGCQVLKKIALQHF